MGLKFCGLTTLDMFVDTSIPGFQIICNITKVKNYFVGILNSWLALPTKFMKLNVQRNFSQMISQYYVCYGA